MHSMTRLMDDVPFLKVLDLRIDFGFLEWKAAPNQFFDYGKNLALTVTDARIAIKAIAKSAPSQSLNPQSQSFKNNQRNGKSFTLFYEWDPHAV